MCFTLIELLVVVAIIAILVSILVPALSRARERAKTILCISNLRQTGVGLLMYADDYGGYFPPSGPDTGIWNLGAYKLVPEYFSADYKIAAHVSTKIPKIWDCPSNPRRSYGGHYWYGPDYSMNYYMFGNVAGAVTKLDGAKIAVADADPLDWYFSPWLISPPDTLHRLVPCHNTGVNFLWTDGHADYRKTDQIPPNGEDYY
ncbi:MAG: type II secretion system GspH family protein [Candidatus Pacebacteria bacterium]|nr:type II secretion system GspH family protein [Candidatus Paceibacterota bacterium]